MEKTQVGDHYYVIILQQPKQCTIINMKKLSPQLLISPKLGWHFNESQFLLRNMGTNLIQEISHRQSVRPWPDGPDGLFSGASSLSTQQRREACDACDGWELCDVRLPGSLTLPETNSEITPENRPKPNRKLIFQPCIFRCYVSFREGKVLLFFGGHRKKHQEIVVVPNESG